MNPSQGLQNIFAKALSLPPEDRAAYLGQSTNGEPELRRRVESLLQSYEAGDFLEEAARPQFRDSISTAVQVTEKPGDNIGRYKLLQQIGEGGCGVVYMAEQVEPVRRRVALKIIKLGMDTKSVIARFEAERQALAMMDHPNIAKVFDAGATATGRPYFVMELVRGVKITEYCDEAKLSTRARLDLFIAVCTAIQHAHQKGIIHRDIKPSNILVTVNDGAPVPKVIDFGIAKATTGQRLTDKTLFTAFEQFIGTPAYMSPEQAVMTSLDIDTRSDIYALGVLLYELLTSKTPFDSQELLAIGLDEMRRTIREQEPLRPSTRLSTLSGQELSTTAQRRGLDAPKLVSEIRGDLDWIIMKALEKDRSRRYETANGLAADVQRHLKNELVVACPPSAVYRFQKLIRRNRLAFTTVGAVAAALLVGFGVSTWMFFRERAAKREQIHLREQVEIARQNDIRLRDLDRAFDGFMNQSRFSDAETVAREALLITKTYRGLQHPSVADALDELAQALVEQRKFLEAERLFNDMLPPGIERQPWAVGLFKARAEFWARRGKWAQAAADTATAIELLPGDYTLHYTRAAELVANGDFQTYRQCCTRIAALFGDTRDPYIADRSAKTCMILPSSGVDLPTICAWADMALNGKSKHPYFKVCKALADYRSGNFDSAAERVQEILGPKAFAFAFQVAQAYVILALSDSRLGKLDEARDALAKAINIEETKAPQPQDPDFGRAWKEDWILVHALINEAKGLLDGRSDRTR